jgi:flagellar biosynthetic protein FlhB
MAESDFEKTEAPTPRRREEARQQGNVARSLDLTAACALLAAVILLHALGLRVFAGLKITVVQLLGDAMTANAAVPDDVGALVWFAGRMTVAAAAPLVLAITAVALLVSAGQVGFVVSTQSLEPNLARLSPLRGLGNLFDLRSGVRLGMGLAKVAVIAAVAVWAVWADLPRIVTLPQLEVAPLFGSACELVYALSLKLALLLLVLALLDYGFQYWRHERDLRMTKHEIKEELKRMEGDPLTKQRRARVARQLALQRVGLAVPKADVVVTNPTHFAVALKYDPANMQAPKVVAKGADFLALRIRQLALQAGVPLVERRELAQALYRTVEVGQEIPPQFYNAVAEILAYVYRLSGRKTA